MAERIIISWRGIPAQVLVQKGRQRVRRELGPRFIQAIDRAAMRAGLTGTDAYLEHWHRSTPEPCGDDLEAEAQAAADALEAAFTPERLRALVDADGEE